jgi:hypothetical protein
MYVMQNNSDTTQWHQTLVKSLLTRTGCASSGDHLNAQDHVRIRDV